MRTITKEIKLYTFKEASAELRDKIREYFHSSGFHGEFMLQERIETLKEFSEHIDGKLDYSISVVPDRGEFITIKDFDQKKYFKALKLKDCPFTGVCYDDDLIEACRAFNDLQTGLNKYLQDIHNEYEWALSDEYLLGMCEANEYEFTENGEVY